MHSQIRQGLSATGIWVIDFKVESNCSPSVSESSHAQICVFHDFLNLIRKVTKELYIPSYPRLLQLRHDDLISGNPTSMIRSYRCLLTTTQGTRIGAKRFAHTLNRGNWEKRRWETKMVKGGSTKCWKSWRKIYNTVIWYLYIYIYTPYASHAIYTSPVFMEHGKEWCKEFLTKDHSSSRSKITQKKTDSLQLPRTNQSWIKLENPVQPNPVSQNVRMSHNPGPPIWSKPQDTERWLMLRHTHIGWFWDVLVLYILPLKHHEPLMGLGQIWKWAPIYSFFWMSGS